MQMLPHQGLTPVTLQQTVLLKTRSQANSIPDGFFYNIQINRQDMPKKAPSSGMDEGAFFL
jgi:hypothetical protein